MKEDICEYYPNKQLKYKFGFYTNGCKHYARYYDLDGIYYSSIWYNKNGKIDNKFYYISKNNWIDNKLNWLNFIKNL